MNKTRNHITIPDARISKHLAQSDLVYRIAPQKFMDGLPLGNGDIGAVIHGRGHPLTVSLDKQDVWEERSIEPDFHEYNYQRLAELIEKGRSDPAARLELKKVFQLMDRLDHNQKPLATRLRLPRLILDFGADFADFKGRLSLHDAVATLKVKTAAGPITCRCFTQAVENLFVGCFEGGQAAKSLPAVGVHDAHFSESLPGRKSMREILKTWGYPEPRRGVKDQINYYLQQAPRGGTGYALAWWISPAASRRLLIVSVCSTVESREPLSTAIGRVKQARAKSFGQLLKPHAEWWRNFWRTGLVALPDARLEACYYLSLYKLACNAKGSMPFSPQGVWIEDTPKFPVPWWGEYALNMNVQMQYWPVYAGNHLALGRPLYDWLWQLLPKLKAKGTAFYGEEALIIIGGLSLGGASCYGWYMTDLWPGLAAWMAHHFWLHWRYSQDRDFLRERAFPFMKLALRPYLRMLKKGADGKYHLPYSVSPEYHGGDYKGWDSDVTGDLFLAQWLARALVEAHGLLALNDPDLPRWEDVLANLAEPPSGPSADFARSGLYISAHQPLEKSHGLHAQLIGLYPLDGLTVEGDEKDRRLINDTFHQIQFKGTGGYTGKSFPWLAAVAARCGRANMAWKLLQDYTLCFARPANAFHMDEDYLGYGCTATHNEVLTLEGGCGLASAVMEMLLQSWGGIIRLFPATPAGWRAAAFHALRAEGAFVVSARRRGGETVQAEIISEAGLLCRIKNNFAGGQVAMRNGRIQTPSIQAGEYISFPTRRGETYVLTAVAAHERDGAWRPPVRPGTEQNPFGLR